jgi:hypothetical protein
MSGGQSYMAPGKEAMLTVRGFLPRRLSEN